MIRKSVLSVLILFTVGVYFVQAQVTVGSNKEPESFSLLEIDSSNKGLRHPQMSTSDRNTLTQNFITAVNKENEARGLVIYNTDTNCLEYYKNKEEGWVSLCSDIVVEQIPLDDATNPDTRDELESIPGVGRKTANVMLIVAFNKPAMPVDTHVFRVSNRIGLTDNSKTPLETEKMLVRHIPQNLLDKAHHWLILHGRYTCQARKPKCDECGLTKWCRYYLKHGAI